jgi:hypothetical protein
VDDVIGLGLDALIPETPTGRRVQASRREAKRVAGEESRRRGREESHQRGGRRDPSADDALDADGQLLPPRRDPFVGKSKSGIYLTDRQHEPKVESSRSWWLGVKPDQFSRAAAGEQERMQRSKHGKDAGSFREIE